MKNAASFWLIYLLITVSLNSWSQENRIPGELIIQLKENNLKSATTVNELEQQFDIYDFQLSGHLSDRMQLWDASYNPAMRGDDLLKALRSHPGVSLAQYNHRMEIREQITDTIPNDTLFDKQWGLHNTGQTGGIADADVDAPEAWAITQGGRTVLGDTIVVAVVDGGMDLNHEDLKPNLWTNYGEIPGNGEDDDGNGYVDDIHGWNAYSDTSNIPKDDHGAHVAGIISAKGGNETGVTGVSWHSQIMSVAASSSSEKTVIKGYSYIHKMRSLYNETNGKEGAFVVATNSSFGVNYGDPEEYPIWGAMYDSLGAKGILNAAATANIGMDIDEKGDVPTAMESDYMISVTNTTDEDEKNSGAGYGRTTIDLGAPGTSVYSTTSGNSYGYKSGTSMATPHVTGAIALLFSNADSAMIEAYREKPDSIAFKIKEYLLYNVDPLPALEGITVSGGRLNLYNSLMAMDSVPVGPQMVISNDSLERRMRSKETDTLHLSVYNSGGGTMNYHVAISDSAQWISTDFETGTLYRMETDTIDFSIAGDSLDPGKHTGEIYFVHNEDTLTTTVTVEIELSTDIELPEADKNVSLKIAPNPFDQFSRITLFSNNKTHSRVTIYNISGQMVKNLFEGEFSGKKQWIWNGTNQSGVSASPGIYFVRVVLQDRIYTKKLILQR